MKENDLVTSVLAAIASQGGAASSVPPGDDMAGMRLADGRELLVTVDPLIEGVHYDPRTARIEQIAHKAIARNLSDVAAMGATPSGCVVSVILRRDIDEGFAGALMHELVEAAGRLACPLVGGDTAIHDGPTTITVTVFAEPGPHGPVLRSTANVGDAVCITGQLGGSQLDHKGLVPHLDFTPRLEAGQYLAGVATGMMDLSDGLAQDLPRMAEAAQVGADVDLKALPVRTAIASQPDAWRHAIGDGEDYELLFTCPADAIPTAAADVAVTRIGTITAGPDVRFIDADGILIDHQNLGWEHRS